MGKFVFKLDAVLNLKKQVEDNIKNELGKAVKRLEQEKELLRHIELERDEVMHDIKSKAASGISVGKLKEINSYVLLLRDKAEAQKITIKDSEEVVDKYRDELIFAMRERKVMEKLKEKKFEEYLKEQQREDQKLLDEIASFSYETKHN